MTEPSIALEALLALDIVALEWKDDGRFAVLGSPPDWFCRLFEGDDLPASPYLANFLIDAYKHGGKLYSGIWTQRDSAERECGLEAWSVRAAGRRVLLIHLLGEEFEIRRAALQQAREASLANERLGQTTLQLEARNREVERINQLKSEFLASMSHELRTPLNAIIGFSSLLAEENAGPMNAEQQSYVAHVKRASNHLLELINDILDLSKIEAGRLVLSPEEFNLEPAVDEVMSIIRPLARDKGIQLEAGIAPGYSAWADRVRFKQILYNLLSNAIKFTPQGGTVRLDASLQGDQLAIAVTDTGIGIPPGEQDAIFEKFHQAGSGTKGIREGTGLGLAITRRLVEQHGGSIRVFSNPGQGSRFFFTLPRGTAGTPEQLQEAPAVAPAHNEAANPGHNIAIVEDNPANRDLFQAMLRPFYQISTYRSSNEALDGFRREPPDVALIDIALPGMDGVELLHRMRTDSLLAPIPVVAVSAYAMAGDREKFLAAGFDQYVAKPVASHTVLLNAIEPLLQKSGKTRLAS